MAISQSALPLSAAQIQQFIEQGFVRLDEAFPRALADEARAFLWRETGCAPDDPATWTQLVVRLGGYAQEPFQQIATTPRLHAAFDQLVGPERWQPRLGLGTFPIRFPHEIDPGDTGWHVDASFAGADGSWRVNVASRERALLMLFLFSDVTENDAPTRIAVGSHLDVPPLLAPHGEAGLSFMELAERLPAPVAREIALATGPAGTVYLCHPFLVHAAQIHRGSTPRFLAQPPLHLAQPYQLQRADGAYSPVESAIRLGLGLEK